MTRAMALEIARNVRVNCVCSGYVETDMIRISINKSPEQAAREQGMIDCGALRAIFPLPGHPPSQ